MATSVTSHISPSPGPHLTTGQAPFIEQARREGELYIRQPYELYSEENHEAWRRLFSRMLPLWQRHACERYREGVRRVALPADRVPRLEEVNQFMASLTGFVALPVSGYIPAFSFFSCLGRREFPTTITIRDLRRLDYLPEPDIFHDIAGHVPMHTEPAFADAIARFGACAPLAAAMLASAPDAGKRREWAGSILRALARFFWFTIEFGLIREAGETKVYGSGLLSSSGEIVHAVESAEVQRYPFQLEWVINQAFAIHHFQPLLFVIDGFDHLFALVKELESWLLAGRLNCVAPGEPEIPATDVDSFLHAAEASPR